MTEERVCPPFGMGSIDLAAFHAAAAKGHDLEQALEDVKTPVSPLDEYPAADGTKADLLEIAAREGAVADESMSKAEITAAIEANRLPPLGSLPPADDAPATGDAG